MANQYFSVKELLFDIQFTNRSLVHELQNRISRLTNDRLMAAMDRSLEEIIPEDILIKMDSLVLDIGEVDLDSLEETLEPRIIAALEQQLLQQVQHLKQAGHAGSNGVLTVENISGSESLLEFFLLNGTLPWWVQQNNNFNLNALVQELSLQNPSGLKTLIRRVGSNEYVRKRLVFQFNEVSVQYIIQVLEPAEAAYILGYHQEVVNIQAQEQVLQAESSTFSKAVWLFVLTYLLQDRGGDFNRKAFVKSNLVQMAAYFNVHYYDLLRIFYEAVSMDKTYDVRESSLETFIRELTIEADVNAYQPTVNAAYAYSDTAPEKDANTLLKKAELVMYYFRYGTLPAGANGYSATVLANVFAELVTSIPETLKTLFLRMGRVTGFTENYYRLTGQERGKILLYQLYPGVAKSMATFSSLVELLQNKKQFIPADNVQVKQTLTRIALMHILFEDHNALEELTLLRSFVRQLANEYGQNPTVLTQLIHTGLQETFRQGIQHSNLPQLIAALAAEAAPGITDEALAAERTNEPEEAHGILDVLVYLVQYGHVPWWGRHFFETETTEALFQQLMLASPKGMIQLVRFAGTEVRWQKRLLAAASADTLFDIIALLPTGNAAVAMVRQAALWIKEERESADKDTVVIKIMLHALWDDLINYGYRSFSLTGFYSLTILRLAAYFDTDSIAVARALNNGLHKHTIESIDFLLKAETLTNIIHLLEPEAPEAIATKAKSGRAQLVALLKAVSFDTDSRPAGAGYRTLLAASAVTRHEAGKEAEAMLRYYLTWNQLPDDMGITDRTAVQSFIRQLTMLIYIIAPAILPTFLQEDHFTLQGRTEFAGLFDANKGGTEKQLALLLESSNIGRETAPIKTGSLLPAEALQLMEYFFTWNRLPDEWKETEQLGIGVILKDALMTLYEQNRTAVQALLQNETHAPLARVFFHELVSASRGGVEKELALFLQPYKTVYQQKILEQLHFPVTATLLQSSDADYTTTNEQPVTFTNTDRLVQRIDQFLKTDQVAHTDEQFRMEENITEAVVQLYSINQPALKNLLVSNDHQASARMRLHDFFLTQTGYYEREVLRLLQQYWQKDILALLATTEEAALWQSASTSPSVLQYLIKDAGQSGLHTLIEKKGVGWGAGTAVFIQELAKLLEAAIPGNLERDKLLTLLMQFNLLFLSGRLVIKSGKTYVQALFDYIRQVTHNVPAPVFAAVLYYIRDQKGPVAEVLSATMEMVQKELQELIDRLDQKLLRKREWQRNEDFVAEAAAREERERKRLEQLEEISAELERERLREEERLKKETQKLQEQTNNKIYIRNAGLVLLHPFLGTYFSRLGLLDKGKFIDEAMQQRGVLLLQYLVNGRNESEEFELALNKILCGLPVEATVPLTIKLTEDEIAVSEEIFQVIFQRWDKMKNTSVAGFRASFIQREGALSKVEENLELRVEQRPYDMLLQTLPWAFGMIKNAWMNQILTVEWM